MSTAKKISVSILLCIIAMPLLCFISFLSKQQFIENEMNEKLETSFLKTINCPANEINWVKAEKEVLIDGELFDVKSCTVINGNATLVGLFDEKEEELGKKFENILCHQKQEGAPVQQLAIKFLLVLYYSKPAHITLHPLTIAAEIQFLPHLEIFPQNHFPVIIPPPRSACFFLNNL